MTTNEVSCYYRDIVLKFIHELDLVVLKKSMKKFFITN
jgi:hypothetical protein